VALPGATLLKSVQTGFKLIFEENDQYEFNWIILIFLNGVI
jgi:hypothetical protein